VFTEAFQELLGTIQNREHGLNLDALNLTAHDLNDLEALFSEREVWDVIKELPPDRAPGPDGFIGAFYQRAWPVIKGDIMAALMKLAVGDGRGFDKLNRALITLIPKKQEALTPGDYRPISLVHSFSKLFSKIIANRLRPRLGELVSMNQSAFVKGRCLHDNFMLVRQVARKINQRRRKGVLIKLDISRAFDSISWSFLFEVLRHMGFGDLFLKWIALLLYTASTKVIVNGVPGARIKHVRGLRQGDPTSPMLFVIGMEVLTLVFARAVHEDLLQDLVGISPLQRISIYADDVVLFTRAEEYELRTVKELMGIFGEASGLWVNFSKTTATLIRGDEVDREMVERALQCKVVEFPIRYLGLQLALRPLKKAEWQPLNDAVTFCLPSGQRGMIRQSGAPRPHQVGNLCKANPSAPSGGCTSMGAGGNRQMAQSFFLGWEKECEWRTVSYCLGECL
jgi:hypothetical protein